MAAITCIVAGDCEHARRQPEQIRRGSKGTGIGGFLTIHGEEMTDTVGGLKTSAFELEALMKDLSNEIRDMKVA